MYNPRSAPPPKDITGRTFGSLLVIAPTGERTRCKGAIWRCLCTQIWPERSDACGRERLCSYGDLTHQGISMCHECSKRHHAESRRATIAAKKKTPTLSVAAMLRALSADDRKRAKAMLRERQEIYHSAKQEDGLTAFSPNECRTLWGEIVEVLYHEARCGVQEPVLRPDPHTARDYRVIYTEAY